MLRAYFGLFLVLTGSVGIALLLRGQYGWTLFTLVPLAIGMSAALIAGCRTAGRAAGIGALAPFLASLLLLLVRLEGIICIAMSLPIVLPLGALGGLLAFSLTRHTGEYALHGLPLLLLLPAGAGTWAYDAHTLSPVFQVVTSRVVNAPPETVWRHVVSFPDLPEPREWFFRAGVAYPVRARIEGLGVGATRYCEFSTGPFVEPIDVWDAPRLLAFRVTRNPAPMRELSPWPAFEPPHLHGYMVSKKGQFRLTPLPGSRTLLEGTTWYQHGLLPAGYWRWWSDAIIHRIHHRVLAHIEQLAETGRP